MTDRSRTAEPFLPDRRTLPSLRAAPRLPRLRPLGAGDADGVRRRPGASARSCSSASSRVTSEDREGHPFVGPAGRMLDEALERAGIDRGTRLRHQRGEALQVGGARQAAHPPDAGAVEDRRLRAMARSRTGRGPAGSVVLMGRTPRTSVMGEAFRVSVSAVGCWRGPAAMPTSSRRCIRRRCCAARRRTVRPR